MTSDDNNSNINTDGNDDSWSNLKLPASPHIVKSSTSTSAAIASPAAVDHSQERQRQRQHQQLHQLHQLLRDFEAVFALLNMYPELAKTRDPENNNMLPLHTAMMIGAPTTTIMILVEAYPDAIKSFDASGNTPFHIGIIPALQQIIVPTSSQIEAGVRGKSPTADILSILSNLDYLLDAFPEIVQQKDATGNLPLNIFCSSFIPSLKTKIYLDLDVDIGIGINGNGNQRRRRQQPAEEKVARAVTQTLEKIYRASPSASEIIGPSTGSPVGILVGECAAAKSVDDLLRRESVPRLKLLLETARDGRALQTLFSLDNPVSLWAFFSLFDEGDDDEGDYNYGAKVGTGTATTPTKTYNNRKIVLDLNKEVLSNWCLLDIVADFDTADAASALLQIIIGLEHKQKKHNNNKSNHPVDDHREFAITNEDGDVILEFVSRTKVSDIVRTRVADRAKLSNSSPALKKWGQGYGALRRVVLCFDALLLLRCVLLLLLRCVLLLLLWATHRSSIIITRGSRCSSSADPL